MKKVSLKITNFQTTIKYAYYTQWIIVYKNISNKKHIKKMLLLIFRWLQFIVVPVKNETNYSTYINCKSDATFL